MVVYKRGFDRLFVVLIITLIITLLFSFSINAETINISNFIEYRQITVNSPGTIENFSMSINIDSRNLIARNLLNSNCSNIQITKSDKITLINSWSETINAQPWVAAFKRRTGCNGNQGMDVWFKVNLTTGDNTFFVYYGNANKSYSSNANNIFHYYNSSFSLNTTANNVISANISNLTVNLNLDGSQNYKVNMYARRAYKGSVDFKIQSGNDLQHIMFDPSFSKQNFDYTENTNLLLQTTSYNESCKSKYEFFHWKVCTDTGESYWNSYGSKYHSTEKCIGSTICPNGFTYYKQSYYDPNPSDSLIIYGEFCRSTNQKTECKLDSGKAEFEVRELFIYSNNLSITHSFSDPIKIENKIFYAPNSAPLNYSDIVSFRDSINIYANTEGVSNPSCTVEFKNNGTRYSMDYNQIKHNFTLTNGLRNESTYVDVDCAHDLGAINLSMTINVTGNKVYNCSEMRFNIRKNRNVELQNNIDCSGDPFPADWHGSAGGITTYYEKEFNGNGKVITSMNISQSAGNKIGLIPLFKGKIYNLTLSKFIVNNPTKNYVGSLFGDENYKTKRECKSTKNSIWSAGILSCTNTIIDAESPSVSNIVINGNVTGDNYVGGISGLNSYHILNVSLDGKTIGNSYVGGVSGFANGRLNKNIASFIYLNSTINGTNYTGGLFGKSQGTIGNSFFNGTVNVYSGNYTGTLSGYLQYGDIFESYSHGTLNVNDSNYVGGLIGYMGGPSSIKDSYIQTTVDINNSNFYGGVTGYGETSVAYLGSVYNVDIKNVYSTINTSIGTNTIVGTVIGYDKKHSRKFRYHTKRSKVTLLNSYVLDPAKKNNQTGREYGKTTTHSKNLTELQTQATYQGWDFTNIWEYAGAYPFLRVNPLLLSSAKVSSNLSLKVNRNNIDLTTYVGEAILINSETISPVKDSFTGNKHILSVFNPQGEIVYQRTNSTISERFLLKNVGVYKIKAEYLKNSKVNYSSKVINVTTTFPFPVAIGVINNVNNCSDLKNKIIANVDINITGNIDCSGTDFTDWSSDEVGYTKTNKSFNGNNYVIKNIYINSPDKDNVALFPIIDAGGSIINAVFKNITVIGRDNVSVIAGKTASANPDVSDYIAKKISILNSTITGRHRVGGIGGYISGYIKNSFVNITITAQDYVGGLVGHAQNVAAKDVHVRVDITADDKVGGIAGYANKASALQVFVEGKIGGELDVGGLVGQIKKVQIPEYSDIDREKYPTQYEEVVNQTKELVESLYYIEGVFFEEMTNTKNANQSLTALGNWKKAEISELIDKHNIQNPISELSFENFNGLNSTEILEKELFESDGFDVNNPWTVKDGSDRPRMCGLLYDRETNANECDSIVISLSLGYGIRGKNQITKYGFTTFNISVGDDYNNGISPFYREAKTVTIRDEGTKIIEFDHNFGSKTLNMKNTIINKTVDSLHIKNLNLIPNTKTLYTQINQTSTICLKDSQFNSIGNITDDCSAADEYIFEKESCRKIEIIARNNKENLECYLDSTDKFIIYGVENSGVVGSRATSEIGHTFTDLGQVNEDIIFKSNYRNNFKRDLISGATCTLNIQGETEVSMSEDLDDFTYTLDNGKSTNGTYTYNVSCAATGENTVFVNNTFEVGFIDADEDGTYDGIDKLKGKVTDIKGTGFTNRILAIGSHRSNNNNVAASYTGVKQIQVLDGPVSIISYLHNFSKNHIKLSDINVTKTANAVLVRGVDLLAEFNKTITAPISANTICVKNKETTSITDISSACDQAGEIIFTKDECIQATSKIEGTDIIKCTYDTSRSAYVVSGLRYSLVSGLETQLETTDNVSGDAFLNEEIQFRANYTNSTSGNTITGATCNIEFHGNGSEYSMTYNSPYYIYNHTGFSTAQTVLHNVTCSASGYVTLTAEDSVSIYTPPVPEFEDIALMITILGSICISGYIRKQNITT
ncbi:hypothetical protein HOK68_02250 [Candidatus Woesearchaeota archaeon]|mgnify:CR=1 FL=1|nr:hypothetical protein [Candidatus Woesearchaeota archaeon]MBT4388024.1 hypothetical protein [Candidatus Woesearchaeota archaeon]MBT4596289.1 hypothetical protein [Candidatus Woesearchaeota archaeon]MBT5740791.1 hypothetical protein [Candidatus Woesearchaeota archaeon]MBT6505575.1 hypothetical protein [Candidatus Woesearchaeota archaeon]